MTRIPQARALAGSSADIAAPDKGGVLIAETSLALVEAPVAYSEVIARRAGYSGKACQRSKARR